MKNAYIAPLSKTIVLDTCNLLAGSEDTVETNNKVGNRTQLSGGRRHNGWDWQVDMDE